MKRFSAPSLEEAYKQAAQAFGCSVADLDIEVIQHPANGLFGLFKKDAVIVADCKKRHSTKEVVPKQTSETSGNSEDSIKRENIKTQVQSIKLAEKFLEDDGVAQVIEKMMPLNEEAISKEIEDRLKGLLQLSCFDIDTVEVDVRDGVAYIFIDGNDAALLIGKEGYRYNALSYMLYSWLNSAYGLYIKLEIAQFLTMQQEMIANYLVEVIEEIKQYGKGRTKVLDGVLVHIALEQLREAFPDKYVAIKTDRVSGKKYVLVNRFNRQ